MLELSVKEKELELRERELRLKEKERAFQANTHVESNDRFGDPP